MYVSFNPQMVDRFQAIRAQLDSNGSNQTGARATTYALGEEGGGADKVTSHVMGEEGGTSGGGLHVTTYATGEEGGGVNPNPGPIGPGTPHSPVPGNPRNPNPGPIPPHIPHSPVPGNGNGSQNQQAVQLMQQMLQLMMMMLQQLMPNSGGGNQAIPFK